MNLTLYLFILISILFVFSNSEKVKLIEESFTALQLVGPKRFVLFYFSTENNDSLMKTMRKAAKKAKKFVPDITFYKCDCSLSINKPHCDTATFKQPEHFLFTSSSEYNIERYTGPETATDIANYIRLKFIEYDIEDTLNFTSEEDFYDLLDSDSVSNIFVMFNKEGCHHCTYSKPGFNRAATYFKTIKNLKFMTLYCGDNKLFEQNAFCLRNHVTSYPAFVLFHREKQTLYNLPERSIMSYENFFHNEGLYNTYETGTNIESQSNVAIDNNDFDDATLDTCSLDLRKCLAEKRKLEKEISDLKSQLRPIKEL